MWIDLPDRNRSSVGKPGAGALAVTVALAAVLAVPLLQGCGAFVVAGAATGASMVHDRRDSRTVLEDEHTEHTAGQLLIDNPSINMHSRISTTSFNHLVLLTGQAETQEISDSFARKVANLPKVKKVINEVTVGPLASFSRESEDALITSRVKLALTEIDLPGFDATRVKVVTEEGTVFLMGLVHPPEGDAAAEKARYVPGVDKVVKLFEYI
jgi:osmotically-inducible protein OsmY